MCVQLYNEKPCVGNIWGLNLTVVRPTTFQMTAVSTGKMCYNIICRRNLHWQVSCVHLACSKMAKRVMCPLSTNALSWTLREWRYTRAKFRCKKCGAYSLVEEETSLQNTQTISEQTKFRHGVPTGTETKNECAGEGQQQFTRRGPRTNRCHSPSMCGESSQIEREWPIKVRPLVSSKIRLYFKTR
jgi:hypothetical protein